MIFLLDIEYNLESKELGNMSILCDLVFSISIY